MEEKKCEEALKRTKESDGIRCWRKMSKVGRITFEHREEGDIRGWRIIRWGGGGGKNLGKRRDYFGMRREGGGKKEEEHDDNKEARKEY